MLPDINKFVENMLQSEHGTESLYDSFSKFASVAEPWKLPTRRLHAKKRSHTESNNGSNGSTAHAYAGPESERGVNTTEESYAETAISTEDMLRDQLKYRFMQTVNDATVCGLVALQSNGLVIKRLAYSWIADPLYD